MKQELYYYATSLKNKNLSKASNVCMWILLSIFLLPLILKNISLGLLLFLFYLSCYKASKTQKDKYEGELLNFGSFLLFLGIEFFAGFIIVWPEVLSAFAVVVLAFWISYEIIFLIRIKKKQYSKGASIKSNFIFPVTLGLLGTSTGKLIAKIENSDFPLWLGVIVSSAIIVYSFSFFQKFFIHKIIKDKEMTLGDADTDDNGNAHF